MANWVLWGVLGVVGGLWLRLGLGVLIWGLGVPWRGPRGLLGVPMQFYGVPMRFYGVPIVFYGDPISFSLSPCGSMVTP